MSIALLDKVRKVLDNIGKNGTAPEPPKVPKEIGRKNEDVNDFVECYNLLHEYYLIDFAASFIGKKRDKLLKDVKRSFEDEVTFKIGETHSKSYHDLVISRQVKNPATRLDKNLLASKMREHGLTQETIDKIFAASMVDNKPAESWSVTPLNV